MRLERLRAIPEVWRLLTRWDRLLMAGVLLTAVASMAALRLVAGAGGVVRIEVGGQLRGEYPLHQPREVRVVGPVGTTLVEIGAGGWVRVRAAPCANQLCRLQGRIGRRGEVLVCVPNRLVVTVVGTPRTADVDAVVR